MNRPDIETYNAYTELQSEYEALYKTYQQQYESCKCFKCKMKLVTFGLDLLALNKVVEQMEFRMTPKIGTILESLNIDFDTTENGETTILN